MRTAVLVVVLVLACACGNGATGVDAAPPDAGTDAAVPDASAADRCMTLCTCGTSNCPVQFPDLTACMTECAGFEDSVKACRIEHCGYAQTNPGFHCPHAVGDDTSPGFPPACAAP